jgi:hypothetical protein
MCKWAFNEAIMVQNLRIKHGAILLCMLAGWGAVGIGANALPPQIPQHHLPPSSLLVQATSSDSQGQGSLLTFDATSPADELKQLQLQLTKTVVALPVENTTLGPESLGVVALTGGNGDRQTIGSYTWTVVPTSQLYLGRSGYKSLLARYQYAKDRQSPKYTLDIKCQTVGLKTQDQASCSLFGNGPLLKGEVKTTGRLVLLEAPPVEAPIPEAPVPTQSPAPAPTPTPAVVKPQTSVPSTSGASHPGQGVLVMFPSKSKAKEERYNLTRVTVNTAKNVTRLSLAAKELKTKSVVFQGQLEATKSGHVLSISTVDGVKGQGKVFVGNNGLLRTTAPIFVGSEEREITVYFRPN